MKSTMNSWTDYWEKFNALLADIEATGQQQIIDDLRTAQKNVNGITDGWFDFKQEFEKTIKSNKSLLTNHQVDNATELIEFVDDVLKNR